MIEHIVNRIPMEEIWPMVASIMNLTYRSVPGSYGHISSGSVGDWIPFLPHKQHLSTMLHHIVGTYVVHGVTDDRGFGTYYVYHGHIEARPDVHAGGTMELIGGGSLVDMFGRMVVASNWNYDELTAAMLQHG